MFEIKKATRQGIKPIIDLYSESGCGKTYSALLLARGFVGPTGNIAMIDSESGRGSLYADVIPGGYNVLEISKFAPADYIEAMQEVEKSGAQIGIIDSASHEWEGIGGVLDMAGANEEKSGKPGLHNWRVPKMEHAKFMLKLLQSPLPWIVCLRAKHKSRQIKGTVEMAESGGIRRDQVGKTIIIKDDHTSPIQADDFIFEATVHAEILQDHSLVITKCSHHKLGECFPEKGPIKLEHGEAVARWCSSPQGPGTAATTSTASKPAATVEDPRKVLCRELWKLSVNVRGPENNWTQFEIWAVARDVITDSETVLGMTVDRLREVIESTKKKLTET